MQISQEFYRCIDSSLKWCELHYQKLEKKVFENNPYDRCVGNKLINGKRCTIVWCTWNDKASHKDPEVVSSAINLMKENFGDLKITRGKKHRFIGMSITLNKSKSIEMGTKELLEEAIDIFPLACGKEVSDVVMSLAQNILGM